MKFHGRFNRTYSKMFYVNCDRYVAAHQCKPRGTGWWVFRFAWSRPDWVLTRPPVDECAPELPFYEAKLWSQKRARALDCDTIEVLP